MALAAEATALGLVAAMPSGPGPIPDTQIAEIAASMVGRCETVLLTAETTAQGVAEHIDRAGPVRAVQLVDAVALGVIPMVRLLHPGLRIIEVVHVNGPEAVTAAKNSKADIVLLDSGRAGTDRLGGTGQVSDWSIAAQCVQASPKPVWLAGGLRPEIVSTALGTVRPAGLDVCSGLRVNGALDQGLLDAFVAAANASGVMQ